MNHEIECLITLDNYVFFSGKNLSGELFVNFKVPMEIKNICVEVKGEANCKWTETEGSSEKKVTYTGNEELLNIATYVAGDTTGQNTLRYERGRSTFPFNFQLPANLPSSVEVDNLGHIRYYVKATIDKSWNYEANTKQSFILKETIDTNHPTYCNTKPAESVSKPIVCCCISSGILSLTGNINYSAYCSGEAILINAIVQNQSTIDMRALKAKLTKKVEVHAQNRTRTKSEKTIINKIQGPPIGQGQTRMFSNHELMVHTATPSILNCSIISVSYELSIYVDVPCGFDLDIEIPIIIGTIPRSNIGFTADLNWQGNAPSAPPVDYSCSLPSSSHAADEQRKPLNSEMPPSYDSIYGQ